MVAVVDN